MKKHFKPIFTMALVAIMMSGFVMSCTKKEDNPSPKPPRALEINLMESADLFASALKERNADQAFVIEDIRRVGVTLLVKVKGGSTEDSFNFIWDGRIQESHPKGIMLVMNFDNKNGNFDKDKELIVTVNLQKILGDAGNTKDFHFFVMNGSKKQQKNLNPDGTVGE